MPISAIDIITTAGLVYDTKAVPLEKGDLRAVSVFNPNFGTLPGATFIEVGLANEIDNPGDRRIILLSGLVGGGNVLTWTGKIITETGLILFIAAQSNLTTTTRIGIYTSEELKYVKQLNK